MEADRRDRAMRRRAMLLLRQKRKEEARQVREVGHLLCEQGVRWVRVPAKHVFEHLREKTDAPAVSDRFDWRAIRGSVVTRFSSTGEASLLLQAALARYAASNARVVLVFHTHESAIRMGADDLALHLPTFIENVVEFWIVSAEAADDWLIDFNRFDHEVCHAPRLS